MRRRLAAAATGAALLIGTGSALTPASGTVLCPPGCVSVGTVKGFGPGFLTPDYVDIHAVISMVATTRTGGMANAVSASKPYSAWIWGYVTPGANGTVSGYILFHADNGLPYPLYDTIDTAVKVTGTTKALHLNGGKVTIDLAAASGGWTGTFVATA